MSTLSRRNRSGLTAGLSVLLSVGPVLAQSAPASSPPTTAAVVPPPPPAPTAPAPPPAAPPAPASDAADLSATLTGQAKADYDAAKLLFRDRDYAGALVKFESAFDASHEARLLFDMAACEKNLRHYAKTIRDFERYRDAAGASLTPAERDQVERYLHEFQPFVAPLRVNAAEAGASVYIDDNLVGTTPVEGTLQVDIGLRRVRVVKDGFREFTTTIAVRGSAEMRVDAQLEKIVHEGRVVIHAGAKDTISLDGKVVGTGDFQGPLESGGHQLKVTGDGMVPFQSEVVVQDNKIRTVDVTLQAVPHGGLPAWAWISGGVVIAGGLAVGGYFIFKPQDQTTPAAVGTMSPGTVQLSTFR